MSGQRKVAVKIEKFTGKNGMQKVNREAEKMVQKQLEL